MKNLNDFGVQEMDVRETKTFLVEELSTQEKIKTEGGIIPCIVVAGTLAFWGAAFYGSFKAGYDAAR